MRLGQNERRFHPRFSIDIDVKIDIKSDSDNFTIDAHAENLSEGGIEITCHQDAVDQLSKIAFPHACVLGFKLKKNKLSLPSRLIVNRRKSQNDYHLGFKFIDIDDELTEKLRSEIEQVK